MTPEEKAAADLAELEATPPREPSLRETLPKVCLHPEWWCPPVLITPVKPSEIPVYRAYRASNRVFRRAFGRGEMHRKILLACGEAKLKEKS